MHENLDSDRHNGALCANRPEFSDSTVFVSPRIIAGYDSSFLIRLKKFYNDETGKELPDFLYTEYKPSKDFEYLMIISCPDRIEVPEDISKRFHTSGWYGKIPYFKAGKDSGEVKRIISECDSLGYHSYYFHGMFDSRTYLNKEFCSISKEETCFIVFHELTHNYVFINEVYLPHNFNEAICEVVSMNFALKYAEKNDDVNIKIIMKRIKMIEDYAGCINYYVSMIRGGHGNADSLRRECKREVCEIYRKYDASYQNCDSLLTVNNAYLLLGSFYYENYFTLNDLYRSSSSFDEFIEKLPVVNPVISSMAVTVSAVIKYMTKQCVMKGTGENAG